MSNWRKRLPHKSNYTKKTRTKIEYSHNTERLGNTGGGGGGGGLGEVVKAGVVVVVMEFLIGEVG